MCADQMIVSFVGPVAIQNDAILRACEAYNIEHWLDMLGHVKQLAAWIWEGQRQKKKQKQNSEGRGNQELKKQILKKRGEAKGESDWEQFKAANHGSS